MLKAQVLFAIVVVVFATSIVGTGTSGRKDQPSEPQRSNSRRGKSPVKPSGETASPGHTSDTGPVPIPKVLPEFLKFENFPRNTNINEPGLSAAEIDSRMAKVPNQVFHHKDWVNHVYDYYRANPHHD